MEYIIQAQAIAHKKAEIKAKKQSIEFAVTSEQKDLAGPAELLVSAFAACCLKNVERFSSILKFDYELATIKVKGTRQEKPPKIFDISYELIIKSKDTHLNIDLLHKNIQKFGTIYNTLKDSCNVNGKIILDI